MKFQTGMEWLERNVGRSEDRSLLWVIIADGGPTVGERTAAEPEARRKGARVVVGSALYRDGGTEFITPVAASTTTLVQFCRDGTAGVLGASRVGPTIASNDELAGVLSYEIA